MTGAYYRSASHYCTRIRDLNNKKKCHTPFGTTFFLPTYDKVVQGNIYHRVFNIYSKMVPCRYCVHIFTRYCTHLHQVLYTFLPGTVHISTRYCLYRPTRYRRTRITGLAQFVTWQGSICLVRPYQVPRPRVCDTFYRYFLYFFFSSW